MSSTAKQKENAQDSQADSQERYGRVVVTRRTEDYQAVEMREPVVEDLIACEKLTRDKGFEFMCALVSQIATFDGRRLPMEDVKRLPVTLFFELSQGLMALGLDRFASMLSPSADSPAGGSETSSQ